MTTPTTQAPRELRTSSFRWLRWLLLAALVLVAAGTAVVYRARLIEAKSGQRPLPPRLAGDLQAKASRWEWGQSADGKPLLAMSAEESAQDSNTGTIHLKKVELRIHSKDGKTYDRVNSDFAEFSMDHKKLYAPGEAVITMNLPSQGEPKKTPTSIRAAGITFDNETQQAMTDQHVTFAFEGGDGTCTGAAYDPITHQLQLAKDVSLNLHGKDAKSTPMKVEAGQLVYSETDSQITLSPWSKMVRDQTAMNAATSVIHLVDKKLHAVDADTAVGTDRRPGKQLEYSAEKIHVEYNEDGEIEKLNALGKAKLVSHGNGATTAVTGNSVDLFFNTETGESILSSAVAKGNASVDSRPLADPKGNTPDTKILKSDSIDMHMKADGRDIDRIATHGPGVLEFQPQQIVRHRRILKASDMDIRYGAKSEIQSFHAVNAATETYPSEFDRRAKKPNLFVANTSSKTIDAAFNENAELRQMKQIGDFHYSEGARKAQADSATLENDSDLMVLDMHARVSDDTGSTAADHIELGQDTGDFDARGHVSTTRLPDAKKTTSDMLDKDEPTLGMADRVTSANRNKLVHYMGSAMVWQAANRVQADRIDIDRDRKSMVADGKVVSQFEEAAKPAAAGKKPVAPAVTIVRAPHMVYTDADRQAVYTGGADFRRPSLSVKSSTIKAFLNDSNSGQDSRINHAFADGKVEIVDLVTDRQRVGTGEHAEYFTAEGKVILSGGEPHLKDSLRGDITGEKLTYFANDDRLVGEKPPQGQVVTHILNKKKR